MTNKDAILIGLNSIHNDLNSSVRKCTDVKDYGAYLKITKANDLLLTIIQSISHEDLEADYFKTDIKLTLTMMEENNNMKQFSKKDLLKGNVVETRDGSRYIYTVAFGNSPDSQDLIELTSTTGGFSSTRIYTYYLKRENREYARFDIMKVYKDYTCQEVLWERKEIELSDCERSLLGALPCEFKYIARDKRGDLFVFDERPVKYDEYSEWVITGRFANAGELKVFNHLFQFVKWEDEEPYYIPDLFKLKGE